MNKKLSSKKLSERGESPIPSWTFQLLKKNWQIKKGTRKISTGGGGGRGFFLTALPLTKLAGCK